MKVEYHHIKHFGPSVLNVKIPKEIINKINLYVDVIIKDYDTWNIFGEKKKI